MNTESFNIVILPDDATMQTSCEMSAQLTTTYPSKFTLDAKTYFPHITLYQAPYPAGSLETVIATLDELVLRLRAVDITLSGISNYAEFIFWDAEKTPGLQSLHETVMTTLNPIRNGVLSEDNHNALKDPARTPAEVESVKTYGYLLGGALYQPHITLTKVKSHDDVDGAIAAAQKQIPAMTTFSGRRIALMNLGHDGTVNTIYKEWSLA